MKKSFNILGYIISLVILLPLFLIKFIYDFQNITCIISLIVLAITIVGQCIHYKKTKIKNYGIRMLITLIIMLLCSCLVQSAYGTNKNKEAKNIQETIDKIEMVSCWSNINTNELQTGVLTSDQFTISSLDNKDNTKLGQNATIYYKDGTIETTKMHNCTLPWRIDIKGTYYKISVQEGISVWK